MSSKEANRSAPADKELSKTPGLPARRLATVLLTRIIDDKRNLDALIDRVHGLDPWLKLASSPDGIKDQNLIRAILVTALRNRNRILVILKKLLDRPLPKNARFLNHALHVAAAQILFMDVPDSAAANIAVTMIGQDKRTGRFKSLSNAILRRMVREKEELLAATANIDPLPQWLTKQLRSDYGKQKSSGFGGPLLQEAAIDLSVKSDPQGWAEKLEGVVLPMSEKPEALRGTVRLKSRKPVHELAGFENGEWWVQDVAATIPARVMGDIEGLHVADLCAAPGGKTAQLVLARAVVTAVEASRPRAKRLAENLARLNLIATIIEADLFEWQPETSFDSILLDAPCSSTGTMRHNPDIAWTRTPQEITDLAALQKRMILKAAEFLKPGGRLIFANCSILKAEGENLYKEISSEENSLQAAPIDGSEFPELAGFINGQGAIRTLPTDYAEISTTDPRMNGMDAFFCCRFTKA